jgi:predicted  nucleic acid-binding Zn-ribbon protein
MVLRPDRRVDELVAQAERQRKRLAAQGKEIKDLQARVAMLEDELNDARAQGRRIGEIADVVTALLGHEAAKRDPEVRQILDSLVREA